MPAWRMAPPNWCLAAERLLDEILAPGQHRPDRATQALGQIDPNAVARAREHGRGVFARHHRVEQPGAIHVDRQAVLPRDGRHRLDSFERPDAAAAQVTGLLDRYQGRARRVAIVPGPDRGRHHRGIEHAAPARQRPHHQARERRRPAGFEMQRVGGLIENDLLPGPRPDPIGDLVAHGARGQEQGARLAQQFGDPVLQPVHRGILAALLVADLGLGDGLAHGRRGPGLGIAIEVDARPRAGFRHSGSAVQPGDVLGRRGDAAQANVDGAQVLEHAAKPGQDRAADQQQAVRAQRRFQHVQSGGTPGSRSRIDKPRTAATAARANR